MHHSNFALQVLAIGIQMTANAATKIRNPFDKVVSAPKNRNPFDKVVHAPKSRNPIDGIVQKQESH